MKNNVKHIVISAFVAAVYVVLTVALGDLGYNEVQLRVSEVMIFLAFIDPLYITGLVAGCFIANLIGPFGLPDAFLGSIATALALYTMYLSGKLKLNRYLALFIGSLGAVVFNALIVAFEIVFILNEDTLFWICAAWVAAGEFIVVSIIGVAMWGYILSKESWVNVFRKIR